jgi:hypothetical protein
MNHELVAVSLLLTWNDTSGNSKETTAVSVGLISECQCGRQTDVRLLYDVGSAGEVGALVETLMSGVFLALGPPVSVKHSPGFSSD